MRIAQIAPPFESVPPNGYGGTERVVSTLTEELVRRGHEVTLFASGDSRTAARLEPTVDKTLWHREPPLKDLNPFWSTTLDAIWSHVDEFDVLHSHLDYWGYPLARHSAVPVVTTLHGRLDLPEPQPLYRGFADVPLVSISDAQRAPVAWANFVATIHHGVELDQFTFNPRAGRYLAFLGRISPEKGLDTAIRAGQQPSQLAHSSDGCWWNEAWPEKPVKQQVGNPLCVLDIGLPAWHGSHVLRIDQDECAPLVLNQVEDRPPVHAS